MPQTWGEALQFRIKKQIENELAPPNWSNKFPNGSIYDPKVTK
ncbi:hypothetical protein COH87_08290 [Neisseria meningitidis]|nr:hypothetical protein COH87_08290 [Neisseria meningitidis]